MGQHSGGCQGEVRRHATSLSGRGPGWQTATTRNTFVEVLGRVKERMPNPMKDGRLGGDRAGALGSGFQNLGAISRDSRNQELQSALNIRC